MKYLIIFYIIKKKFEVYDRLKNLEVIKYWKMKVKNWNIIFWRLSMWILCELNIF